MTLLMLLLLLLLLFLLLLFLLSSLLSSSSSLSVDVVSIRSFEIGVSLVGFEELVGDHIAEVILFLTLYEGRSSRANVFDDLKDVHSVLQLYLFTDA
jgi:hypothetical protein